MWKSCLGKARWLTHQSEGLGENWIQKMFSPSWQKSFFHCVSSGRLHWSSGYLSASSGLGINLHHHSIIALRPSWGQRLLVCAHCHHSSVTRVRCSLCQASAKSVTPSEPLSRPSRASAWRPAHQSGQRASSRYREGRLQQIWKWKKFVVWIKSWSKSNKRLFCFSYSFCVFFARVF